MLKTARYVDRKQALFLGGEEKIQPELKRSRKKNIQNCEDLKDDFKKFVDTVSPWKNKIDMTDFFSWGTTGICTAHAIMKTPN